MMSSIILVFAVKMRKIQQMGSLRRISLLTGVRYLRVNGAKEISQCPRRNVRLQLPEGNLSTFLRSYEIQQSK